jgi:hypothetical protein
LAIFTAIRCGPSRVNSFAADLCPGSSGVSSLVAAILQQGWRWSGPSVFVTPAEKYVIEHGVSERHRNSCMRTEKHEKVLEKLAASDKATIIIERQTELKCALRQGLG